MHIAHTCDDAVRLHAGKRMGVDYLDCIQIHDPEFAPSYVWGGEEESKIKAESKSRKHVWWCGDLPPWQAPSPYFLSSQETGYLWVALACARHHAAIFSLYTLTHISTHYDSLWLTLQVRDNHQRNAACTRQASGCWQGQDDWNDWLPIGNAKGNHPALPCTVKHASF